MAKRATFPVKETILELLKQKKKATFEEILDYLEQKGYAVKANLYRRRAVKGMLTKMVQQGVIGMEGEGDKAVYVYKPQ
jgi:predicted transcriptional regulator